MKHIVMPDGKRYEWKTIHELRRAQIMEARRISQIQLFELKHDARPLSERTAAGRYLEPSLFKE
jgi:hypothetical protein